jgi:IS4 transposase
MYKDSTFGKILKLLDREIVVKSVEKHKSDKYSKGFGTWNQLVAMLFAQFSNCRSLRDLEIRFNTHSQFHYHLRSQALKKSTLSDSNRNRDCVVFRDIANAMIKGQGKEMQTIISLIDSSMIRVDSRGSKWTDATKTRCGKGLKLHVQSDGNGIIEDAELTATNVNDISTATQIALEEGRIYVFDKGYNSFDWWHKIASCSAYFVTRIKKNTAYRVVEERDIKGLANVTRDCTIILSNKHPRGGKKNPLTDRELRLVEVYDSEHDKTYQFITNLFVVSAGEIGDYYKSRWGIELLFKWLKQNLKVTKFLGESENAIKVQIYIALIAYVLLCKFKQLSGAAFRRIIDLLYWVKGAIYSYNTPLKPPPPKHRIVDNNQFCFEGVL